MARSAASFVKPVPRRVVSTVSNTVPFRTETVENREKKESRVALFGKQKLLLEIINSLVSFEIGSENLSIPGRRSRDTLYISAQRRDFDTYYFVRET